MLHIFVNLKRFDVPRTLGGLCPVEDPVEWIRSVVRETVELKVGVEGGIRIIYLVPESLLRPVADELDAIGSHAADRVAVGAQGVFRENVVPGGNFGAFTTNLPAAAAVNLVAEWAIIGHSEERKDKLGIIAAYDESAAAGGGTHARALDAVNRLIAMETTVALDAGINVLLCMGESAEQRGDGEFEYQKPRIGAALRSQVETGLKGVKDRLDGKTLVIGYEPIWAIGPGKTPPGAEYIEFVSRLIKDTAQELYGFEPDVVYGGGLKEDNAAMLAGVSSIDGGLVALTKFTQPIAFEPTDLKVIVDTYTSAKGMKE
jgi:triosephosphate isomerase (TIM)